MSNCITIPIKHFEAGKTRLAPVLSPQERMQFAACMFQDVLATSTRVVEVNSVQVVTPDATAASIARDKGTEVLFESRTDGLNQAARIAINCALEKRVENLLIIHADLPLLQPADLSQFFALDTRVAIAPSHNLDGTNALLLNPPNIIDPRYGRMSFDTHRNLALRKGIEPTLIRNERIALDIDIPADLKTLCTLAPAGASGRFLQEHHIPERLRVSALPQVSRRPSKIQI